MAAQRESVQPSNESRQRHIATSLAPSPCAAVILETAPFNVYAAVAYVYAHTGKGWREEGVCYSVPLVAHSLPPPSSTPRSTPWKEKPACTHARAHTHTLAPPPSLLGEIIQTISRAIRGLARSVMP